MRKPLVLLTILLLLGSIHVSAEPCPCPPSSPFACTSFAVYSEETWYGMNFDYPDVEIRFTIRPSGDMKVFQMEFLQEDEFVPTVGMNSAGLFASCQMLFPVAYQTPRTREQDVYPWQVYDESLFNFQTVEEINAYLDQRRVIHWRTTLHDLFADRSGDAMVVEVGIEDNIITRVEDDVLVMTNFPNGSYSGKSYTEVEGIGADRYIAAHRHIADNFEAFNVGRALEALEAAVSTGDWPTLASMVFDPEQGDVYIALNRDFNRIWVVSIEDQTVEPYSGSNASQQMRIDSAGVLASDLAKLGISRGPDWGSVVVGIVVLVGGVGLLLARRRRRFRFLPSILGIVAPVFLITLVLGLGELEPGYDPITDTMSLLGSVGGVRGGMFLIGSGLTGLMIIAFALGLHDAIDGGGGAKPGSILLILSGVGLIGSAFFHCNADCVTILLAPTLSGRFHILFAFLSGACLALAPLALFFRLKARGWIKLRWFTLIVGILANIPGLVFWVSFLTTRIPAWEGWLQRLGFFIPIIWVGVMAGNLHSLEAARGHRFDSLPES